MEAESKYKTRVINRSSESKIRSHKKGLSIVQGKRGRVNQQWKGDKEKVSVENS